MQRLSFEFLARRVLRDLVIIAHLRPLVKGFSKSFLKNFFPSLPLSQRCFESIPHPLSFVKRFFESFSLFSRFLSVVPPAFFAQPRYYTTPLPFCQHFFVEFLRFGDSVKAHKCLSGFLGRVHKGVAKKRSPTTGGAHIRDNRTD